MEYVLITPLQNEIENIRHLQHTISNQTRKPIIWAIVDCFSTDGTYENCCRLFKGINWVKIVRQKTQIEEGYSHLNLAQAVNEAFSVARESASLSGLEFEFVGKTDASPDLDPDYFEILMKDMAQDDRIAIACGRQSLRIGKRKVRTQAKIGLEFEDMNDIRMYRRDFFESVGGYPITHSPDVVLLVKARNRNKLWKCTNRVGFRKTRMSGSKIGKWKGYEMKGVAMRALGYGLLLTSANSFYHSLAFYPPFYGLAIMIGYLKSEIRGEARDKDAEAVNYFRKERPRAFLRSLKRSHQEDGRK